MTGTASEQAKRTDNRLIVSLLLLVLVSMALLGWYAFFSGPTEQRTTTPSLAPAAGQTSGAVSSPVENVKRARAKAPSP